MPPEETATPARHRRALRLQHRTLPFEVRKTSDDGGHFEGYAARINNIDEYGTIMARGCFDRDIAFFRENGFIGGLNHNHDEPIGIPSEVQSDKDGLFVASDIVNTRHGEDVKKLMKANVIRRMSFGFDDIEKRWLDGKDQVSKYWDSAGYAPTDEDQERAKHGAVLFTRLKVYEGSPVMIGGNTSAKITGVRAIGDADADDKGAEADDDADDMPGEGPEHVRTVTEDGGKWYVKEEKSGKMIPSGGYATKGEADHLLAEMEAHKSKKPKDAGRGRSILTLEDHTLAVLDAVGEYRDRVQQIAGLRASQDRSLAPERVARLRELRDSIDAVVAACQPRAKRSDVLALRRDLLLIDAGFLAP
jgi:HK97 family phage prohead protease